MKRITSKIPSRVQKTLLDIQQTSTTKVTFIRFDPVSITRGVLSSTKDSLNLLTVGPVPGTILPPGPWRTKSVLWATKTEPNRENTQYRGLCHICHSEG